MKIVVYEDGGWRRLLPLVHMRAVFQLRCGMGDLLSRVRALLPTRGSDGNLALICRRELAAVAAEQTGLPVNRAASGPLLFLNGRALWSSLPVCDRGDESWVGTVGGEIACLFATAELAAEISPGQMGEDETLSELLEGVLRRDVGDHGQLFRWPWEIVHANARALVDDWERLGITRDHRGAQEPGTSVVGDDAFVGEDSRIEQGVVIDARDGPVYIDKGVRILPQSYIEGPVYLGPGCVVQPHAALREGTSMGPVCKVGGEVEACVLQGYGNKQHYGFLGHSYIGAWTNLGAGCTNSDLKNTYGTVRVPIEGEEVDSGERFVGLFMGDHSKAGIGTMFPTGSVIGFSSSVAAPRSPKSVPDFAWIDGEKVEEYDATRALAVARKVMARRDCAMSAEEARLFSLLGSR